MGPAPGMTFQFAAPQRWSVGFKGLGHERGGQRPQTEVDGQGTHAGLQSSRLSVVESATLQGGVDGLELSLLGG